MTEDQKYLRKKTKPILVADVIYYKSEKERLEKETRELQRRYESMSSVAALAKAESNALRSVIGKLTTVITELRDLTGHMSNLK